MVIEYLKYATEIVNTYHLRKGTYTLDKFCSELTEICKNAIFEVKEGKRRNSYEGTITIKHKKLLEDVEYLKYDISNKLAYKLGLISYAELFSEGVKNRHVFFIVKEFKDIEHNTKVSLISHLKFMTITSNFLLNQNVLAYITFSTEEIIKIIEDTYTLLHITQNDSNIVSWPSFGKFLVSLV